MVSTSSAPTTTVTPTISGCVREKRRVRGENDDVHSTVMTAFMPAP
jgi:hypothetical protein